MVTMKFKLDLSGKRTSTFFYGHLFNGGRPVEVDDPAIVKKLRASPLFIELDDDGAEVIADNDSAKAPEAVNDAADSKVSPKKLRTKASWGGRSERVKKTQPTEP